MGRSEGCGREGRRGEGVRGSCRGGPRAEESVLKIHADPSTQAHPVGPQAPVRFASEEEVVAA